jgi:hypothetical protein
MSAPTGSGTPSNTLNHLRLFADTNPVHPGPFFADTPLRMKWILRTYNNDPFERIGFMDDVLSAIPANGMYFERRTGQPNWWAVQRANGSSVEVDTRVNAGGGIPNTLQIQRSDVSGSTEFYIDGVLVASDNSNHPPPQTMLNFAMQMGGQGSALIDYASVCVTNLPPR